MVTEKKPGQATHEYRRDKRGRKTAIVLPMREYNELIEDLHDLGIMADRKEEPRESLEEVKRRLRADGLLPG